MDRTRRVSAGWSSICPPSEGLLERPPARRKRPGTGCSIWRRQAADVICCHGGVDPCHGPAHPDRPQPAYSESVSTTSHAMPITLIVGDDEAATAARARALLASRADETVVHARPSQRWPFLHPLAEPLPPGPVVVWAPDAHLAFETRQPPHTRLVTTQANYLFAEWAARSPHTATPSWWRRSDTSRLPRRPRRFCSGGCFGRGASRHWIGLPRRHPRSRPKWPETRPPIAGRGVSRGDRSRSTARLRRERSGGTCGRAAGRHRQRLHGSERPGERGARPGRGARLAPEWAAAHFERGKVWLRVDDMVAAARCFREAARLLPGFGARVGQPRRHARRARSPGRGAAAFERRSRSILRAPRRTTTSAWSRRELGRLAESEAAFRRVIQLEPNLAFGHYNLGHTLFLQGRYHAAAVRVWSGTGARS